MQRGGFVSERDAAESLERALERVRRANGTGSTLTLAGLDDLLDASRLMPVAEERSPADARKGFFLG